MPEHRPCRYEGCSAPTSGSTGYCAKHVHTAHKCSVDGCDRRVAAHSRSRCCPDHHNEAVRLLRKAFKPWGP